MLVGINGTEVFSPADWTVDNDTGVITFVVPLTTGDTVTCGYEFDVPMRFKEDRISIQLENYLAGNTQTLLIEKRVPVA